MKHEQVKSYKNDTRHDTFSGSIQVLQSKEKSCYLLFSK